ncbi:MAG: hypothetical protein KDK45_10530, partial [Leptospiraceae bacterium]|nr:hypothetical protein [Leptospiraceae bacterium]
MDWFLLSYYSIGVFACFLISFIMSIFLGTRRGASDTTKWLAGLFLGFTGMFFGYFMAYSTFHELGAYHRYLTTLVIIGNASFVGFSYNFPRNENPRE